MPRAVVIPELTYPDVAVAAEWLCRVFGFRRRLLIADHRIQLAVGETGAVIAVKGAAGAGSADHATLVRVPDVAAHHATAESRGATIVRPPADYPYGERQYTARDCGGHLWTFSESIADVDPAEWGGTLVADERGT